MSVTRPRGPLPARVYWTRRLLVLGVVLALVFGIGRLLGGGDETAPASPAAQPASAVRSSATTPSAVSTADASPAQGRRPSRKKTRTPLPMPSGPCQDNDVRVEPSPQDTYADDEILLSLKITTYESLACSWEVSAETVAVKLTSGDDRIWSSQDCPTAVPTESVVLRRSKPTWVDVTWSGRRSDSDCSRNTDWAEPGYYHLAAAAMGSEPESEQFQLLPPAAVTITPTPTPKARDGAKAEAGDEETAQPADETAND